MKKLLVLTLAIISAFPAFAAEKKRVIVCTVTTGFRHSSIPHAEKTLAKLAEESGVYEIVDIAQQPVKGAADGASVEDQMKASMAKLDPANLKAKKIDLVIFANTTGDLPLPDKAGFIKWIEEGGNFAAMHSGSDTLHGFRPFIDMLQGEFAGHGAQVPADLVAGDTKHPANAGIGAKWDIKLEEMYLIKSQDRAKTRALWYLNHHPNKADNAGFFPVSWSRMAGKGRVFYTSLGHREDLWSDDPGLKGRVNSVEIAKQYQAHILGGIKWALGLAEGSAEANPDAK